MNNGIIWVRGCVAKTLCDKYGGRIIGYNSEIDLKCCSNGDNCNDHDYTAPPAGRKPFICIVVNQAGYS